MENGIKVTGGNREAAMSPKMNGSINLTYEGKFGLSGSFKTSYKSDYFYSDSHNEKSKPYFITDLTFSKEISKATSIILWTRNVFNQKYTTRGFYFGLIPPEYPDQLWESYADPRQIGLTYGYNI